MLQKPIKPPKKSAPGLSLIAACLLLCFPLAAAALEFRSIVPPKAILFDAPSVEATKVFLLGQGYPVEVIVDLGEWIKIRDAVGSLSWIEGKQLSTKRMVLVLSKTDIKAAEDAASGLVASVEKDVVLELLPASTQAGWVKVKHKDGATGYVPSKVLWGLN